MSNGLSTPEEKKLAKTLQQLESVKPGSCQMGGNERAELEKLCARIRGRLNPEGAMALNDEAQKYIAQYSQVDWFRARVEAA